MWLQRMNLKKQRGAMTLLGAMAVVVSLGAFKTIVDFGNAKLLDRKLDNYAKSAAYMALRTELALTTNMSAAEKEEARSQVDLMLNQVGMTLDEDTGNLTKHITFGNLDNSGHFVPLTTNETAPRDVAAGQTPPDFSAVAIQLVSSEPFRVGGVPVFTPQGKAILGLSANDQQSDSGCYCKNRYEACLNQDLVASDLTGIPTVQAEAIVVKDSDARKHYCNYGYTKDKPGSVEQTKYPYVRFNDAWVGRPPTTVNFWMFYSQSYDGEQFERILTHKPVAVVKGDDPLKNTSGFAAMFSSMFCFFNCPGADLPAKDNNLGAYERSDLNSSIRSSYICEKPGFMMFPTTYPSCDSASNSNDVVLQDSVYVGYQGTCVNGTDKNNVAMSRCLAYNDSGVRYESCLDIERRSAMHMNFFQRMMAFFFGPFLDWERSYEGLDCEMQQMRYVGWLFWGGWQKV
ncbi:hypothetical protein [Thiomicrorhabdus cannonii]|uniref:hypothetical protein n=1 Tax=Thiomicrorhabdus cannonii TaxID=2748011 RepID=UPI0015BB0C0D|nr:hypothetical protein [Thiomicrorhabdus cannonii]